MSTKGRVNEVGEFFKSLSNQDYSNFEVIVVDQNSDDRLLPVIKKNINKFDIVHLRSEVGVSKGRNVGLKAASGGIVCFPDDDCEYFPKFLRRVANFFMEHDEYDGLSGRTVDYKKNDSAGNFKSNLTIINRSNIWSSHNSVSLFLKTGVVKNIRGFDEQMGVGSYFSSSEETDLVVRLIKKKYKIYIDNSFEIYHPQVNENTTTILKDRGIRYGRGVGRLIKKHQDYFGFKEVVKVFVGPIIRVISTPKWQKKIFNLYILIGRVDGYLKS